VSEIGSSERTAALAELTAIVIEVRRGRDGSTTRYGCRRRPRNAI